MATSGTLGTLSGNWKTTYTASWELLSQSTDTLKSKIRLKVVFYTGNTTTISSDYSTFKLDGTTVYSGKYSFSGAGTKFTKTKDIEVQHNADGSFPGRDVTFSTNDYIMGNQSATKRITGVPNINVKASITGYPAEFTDEDNPKITYNNPLGNNVDNLLACISLTGAKDDILYREISKTGTSYTFNLTDDERKLLRQNTTTNSRTVKFYIRTILNGTNYHSSQNSTYKIINANPEFSDFIYEDTNIDTITLTGGNKNAVLGYSNIRVRIPVANKAVAKKEATMVKYRFNNEDEDYSDTKEVQIATQKTTTGDFIVYAIDSRGNSTQVIKNAQKVIDYKPLKKGSIETYRANGVSEDVILEFDGEIDVVNFGSKTNSIKSAKYRYSVAGSNEWSEYIPITLTVSGNTFSFNGTIKGDTEASGFNVNNAYEIEVEIKDELSYVYYTDSFGAGIPHVAYAKEGISIMGAYDEELGGALQLQGIPIIETGTENNTTWIKYANGLMEIIGEISINAEFVAWGNIYSYDMTTPVQFPVKFIQPPEIVACVHGIATAMIGRCNATTEKINFICLVRPNIYNTEYLVSYIAKGRWKASELAD